MAIKPVKNQDQVIQACQVGLTVLSDERSSTPNNLLEGIVSFKSLLRALIAGQLVVCESAKAETDKPAGPSPAQAGVQEELHTS